MSAPENEATLTKTRWLYRHMGLLIALVFVFAAAVAGFTLWAGQSKTETLHVSNRSFKLEVADSAQTAALGLGDRSSLGQDQGMLFVLSGNNSACFWMKDMSFPLDIIWFNAQKRVVHIAQSVSPDSYPHSFCPPQPAKYVIELNAGIVKSLDIQEGQTLQF
jgi:uncharacterized membrane protein (UPF0127 family)